MGKTIVTTVVYHFSGLYISGRRRGKDEYEHILQVNVQDLCVNVWLYDMKASGAYFRGEWSLWSRI